MPQKYTFFDSVIVFVKIFLFNHFLIINNCGDVYPLCSLDAYPY